MSQDRALCPKHGDVGVWPGQGEVGEAPHILVQLERFSGKGRYFCQLCFVEVLVATVGELTRMPAVLRLKDCATTCGGLLLLMAPLSPSATSFIRQS
mgnify:CR=1 FL=1